MLQSGKRIVDFVHINRNECSLLERIEIVISLLVLELQIFDVWINHRMIKYIGIPKSIIVEVIHSNKSVSIGFEETVTMSSNNFLVVSCKY